MKRYEGLFILDLAGREEGLNDVVEKVKSLLAGSGAKVEAVQKMDKKSFVRVTDKKVTGGHFVNVVFEATPTVMLRRSLDQRFACATASMRAASQRATQTARNSSIRCCAAPTIQPARVPKISVSTPTWVEHCCSTQTIRRLPGHAMQCHSALRLVSRAGCDWQPQE